ncbi:hypothetical protein AMTRI_Chr01g133360 [Amborella trichopoda]
MFTGASGQWGYINGKIIEPKEADPLHEKWETENLTVMSWLLHSMQPSISRGSLFLSTATKIWTSYIKLTCKAIT